MKVKVSEVVMKVASHMAGIACGAASTYGFYQPKEPKLPNKSVKK